MVLLVFLFYQAKHRQALVELMVGPQGCPEGWLKNSANRKLLPRLALAGQN